MLQKKIELNSWTRWNKIEYYRIINEWNFKSKYTFSTSLKENLLFSKLKTDRNAIERQVKKAKQKIQ